MLLVSEGDGPVRLCLIYSFLIDHWKSGWALRYFTVAETEELSRQPPSAGRKGEIMEYLRSGGDIAGAVSRKDVDFLIHCVWANPFLGLKLAAVEAGGEWDLVTHPWGADSGATGSGNRLTTPGHGSTTCEF